MTSLSEILHFKQWKDCFDRLFHSERSSILSMFGNLDYDKFYSMSAIQHGKMLFQILYTHPKPNDIRDKIKSYFESHGEKWPY